MQSHAITRNLCDLLLCTEAPERQHHWSQPCSLNLFRGWNTDHAYWSAWLLGKRDGSEGEFLWTLEAQTVCGFQLSSRAKLHPQVRFPSLEPLPMSSGLQETVFCFCFFLNLSQASHNSSWQLEEEVVKSQTASWGKPLDRTSRKFHTRRLIMQCN